MESLMPLKDPGDLRGYATSSSTTGSTGRVQANVSAYLNAGIGPTSSDHLHSILSSDSTSVEFVEVVPNVKAAEKLEEQRDCEEEDSGGGEDEYEDDSQEGFEEIENPNCINPNYLLHPGTPTSDSSSDCQTSPIIPTPESKSSPQSRRGSFIPDIPETDSDGTKHGEKSPIANDRAPRTPDLASNEVSPFNMLAFNANTRAANRSWTVSPTATSVGDRSSNTDSGRVGQMQTFVPDAQPSNIPRFVTAHGSGSGNHHARFTDSSNTARPNLPDPDRNHTGPSSLRSNRLTISTTISTRPTARPIATASIPINPDLAPRLHSLHRWSNRVQAELTSRICAQEQLETLRWRMSDTMYKLGRQLENVSDLTRRLHRQQREIRERENLARMADARKRGQRQE